MLTKNQFDVLYYAVTHTNDVRLSQRSLAQRTGKSLGSVNSLVKQLSALGYIDSAIQVTASGLAALEPYRVTNAVIMAAGMSSRFAPLSYEKPKALLQVKGDILIEREIRPASGSRNPRYHRSHRIYEGKTLLSGRQVRSKAGHQRRLLPATTIHPR